MSKIPGAEIANLFLKAIHREEKVVAVGSSWDSVYCGDVKFRIGGYELVIFNDCGELDYVSWAKAPDGREGDFDQWYDDGDEPVALLTLEEAELMMGTLEGAEVVGR